jgi:uncharacterized protein (TIGR02271 family)
LKPTGIMKSKKQVKERTPEKPSDREQAERVIPVIEEEIIIDKKLVKKEGIIVKKEIISEDVSVDIPLLKEHLDIQRIPLNQYLDKRPEIRYEGDTMIIPVLKEVIEKRLLLVEEIRITKTVTSETASEKITLSKQKVTVTRENGPADKQA